MPQYHGEILSKVDEKGRVLFPAMFRKQISADTADTFMVKKGYEGCLELYPIDVWNRLEKEMGKLNHHNKEARDFRRRFFLGAASVELDKSGRLNIPKRLLEHAAIEKEMVFYAHSYFIEIWNPERLNSIESQMTDEQYSDMAQKVMGNINLFED